MKTVSREVILVEILFKYQICSVKGKVCLSSFNVDKMSGYCHTPITFPGRKSTLFLLVGWLGDAAAKAVNRN
jgi:hypothetical protein